MSKTIVLKTKISPKRRLYIQVPKDVPTGPAEIVLTITPTQQPPVDNHAQGTAAQLARSPLFGMWADRDDIEDSQAYARQLRAQAQRRNDD